MTGLLFIGVCLLALALAVAFAIALLGALFGWRVSARVVDEDELRKAGL